MTINRRDWLKQVALGTAGVSLASSLPLHLFGKEITVSGLPSSTPEAQGVSSAGLQEFLSAYEASKHKLHCELHSFMMLRHGHLIAEGWWAPYRPQATHTLYSLSKIFSSTAMGFAVSDGKVHVEDKVVSIFPDKLPEKVDDNLAELKVKHLLTMSTGHETPSEDKLVNFTHAFGERSTDLAPKPPDWVKTFLSIPIVHEPGSVFQYDSGNSFMLCAIVQKVTGQSAFDYLQTRLFEPFGVHGLKWDTSPMGINTGGWGLNVTTETIAKLGQTYLNKGRWNGKQLLPGEWVTEATSAHIQQPASWNAMADPGASKEPGDPLERLKKTNDWYQGYGYQFWRCRHNNFRGDGAFGQFCIVMPDQDAVVAITSATGDMQGLLNLIWDHILPAIKSETLTPAAATSELKRQFETLTLPLPEGKPSSPTAGKISGKKFTLDSNNLGAASVTLTVHGASWTLQWDDGQHISQIHGGIGKWLDGITDIPGVPSELIVGEALHPVKSAAAGAWRDDQTFAMVWHFYENPHHVTATCRFDGNSLDMELLSSVEEMAETAEKPAPRQKLAGHMAG